MEIFIGVEGRRTAVLKRCDEIGASILVSANSMWNQKRETFCGYKCYMGRRVALDCGGFVAMRLYGGYRWTVEKYSALAKDLKPVWWAQMDYCCEPEIAANKREVFSRIDRTAETLLDCTKAAEVLGIEKPMPVLQGWNPSDYAMGPIYDSGFDWPKIVGVGSVCRRHLRGNSGLLSVLDSIHKAIPGHVRLHLFGVKSTALKEALENPIFGHRIISSDSMAWNIARRFENLHGVKTTRPDAAQKWFQRQIENLRTGQDFFRFT